jgi:ZIP family zinc transporter
MKFDWLMDYNPVLLALFATLFTWLVTALDSSMGFFFKTINKKILNSMLEFAAGVMIAANFWSLLKPAIEMAEESGTLPWMPALIGFISGGAFLFLVDKLVPHLHMGLSTDKAEGIKTSWQRSVLLVLAITLHNIPDTVKVELFANGINGEANNVQKMTRGASSECINSA